MVENKPVPPAEGVAASMKDGKTHLLLAASGSVATIKIPMIITALKDRPNLSIRVVLTHSAAQFLAGQSHEQPTVESLRSLPNVDGLYLDDDEWVAPWTRGANILHIELRRWSDLLLVAPMSANLLAKVTNGISDDLISSVIRAWDTDGTIDGRRKRILVAPSMNTAMWKHPVTARQVRVLEDDWGVKPGSGDAATQGPGWFEVLRPQPGKTLACGDTGSGAMMEWSEIVKLIEARLGSGPSSS